MTEHELVRQLALRYLENCGRRISARDTGNPFAMTGYDFGRNEGVGKSQLHEAAKMLRREIPNLDKMLGGQQ